MVRITRNAALLVIGAGVLLIFALGTVDVYRLRTSFMSAVREAKSIRVEEFTGQSTEDGKLKPSLGERPGILVSRELPRDQWGALGWDVPLVPDASLFAASCYTPHHRIVIEHASGLPTVLEICFLCGNGRLLQGGHDIGFSVPAVWGYTLKKMFEHHGLQTRSGAEYRKLADK